ncbi:MAG: hypothetical protein CML04_08800 [Pseudozobellia sp.]|nr:hypothetical protein [Pseudozobellia sp.]MBG48736.1 hypothetical protein [Pseudozobellia sp.]|tara:strand:+ start:471 stop:806 length:336 start_codon:yes stop_codon:yes gene_type:complete
MRKISLVLVSAMLLTFGNVLANDSEPKSGSNSLSKQISEILSENTLTSNEVDMTAQVRFTLNKEQEIVVLSVDSEDANLENFVKAKLNYKKVNMASFVEGKLYTVAVRVAL